MNIKEIIEKYDEGELDTLTSSELDAGAKLCQERMEAIDNEALDYGESNELIWERDHVEEAQLAIYNTLDRRSSIYD